LVDLILKELARRNNEKTSKEVSKVFQMVYMMVANISRIERIDFYDVS
jgi:hypothetical protein